MRNAHGFREDGTHVDTGVARDPQGFDRDGKHISDSTHTRGLRQPREANGQFAEKRGTESEVALTHAAVLGQEQQQKNADALLEVDALYAQAHAAEKRLIDQALRSILDECRPGTKSILVSTWGGSSDVDFAAFENVDGSIDTDYDSMPAVNEFYDRNIFRIARLTESGSVPRIEPGETTNSANLLVGNHQLHGDAFYRFGERK